MAGRPDPVARLLVVLIAASGAGSLYLAWLPPEQALSHFATDDLGYYLSTARNIVSGAGASLDGVHPTNGFHPAWLVILCGVQVLAKSNMTFALHLSLTLCVLFLAISLLASYATVSTLCSRSFALAIVAVLGVNYRFISIALGGLETALAAACVMCVVAEYSVRGPPRETIRAVRLGVLLGLACLARFDALLLPIAIFIATLTSSGRADFRLSIWIVAIMTATLIAVLFPWFAFSVYSTRVLLPESGRALRAWNQNPWTAVHSMIGGLKLALSLLAPPANDLCNVLGVSPFIGLSGRASLCSVLMLAVVGALVALAAWQQRDTPIIQRVAWIPAYVGVHVAYYLHFGNVGFRYVFPVIQPAILFAAVVVHQYCEQFEWRKNTLHWLPIALILVANCAGLAAYRAGVAASPYHRKHAGLYAAARWLSANAVPNEAIGGFNTGIVSAFSGRPIVNLDGVMNESAISAIENKTLATYVREAGVVYLVDFNDQIDRFMTGFGGDPNWEQEYREAQSFEGQDFEGEKRVAILVRKVGS
jgi:hypothetical protein